MTAPRRTSGMPGRDLRTRNDGHPARSNPDLLEVTVLNKDHAECLEYNTMDERCRKHLLDVSGLIDWGCSSKHHLMSGSRKDTYQDTYSR